MLHFAPIPAAAVGRIVGKPITCPIIAYAGIEDGEVLGIGALSFIADRCWLEFDALHIDRHRAARVVRLAHRMLRTAQQVGETEVYTVRNADHPHSARLLKIIGFEFTGEQTIDQREVWAWPKSAP